MKYLLILLVLSISHNSFCQKTQKLTSRADTIKILQDIVRKGEMISTSGGGYAGVPVRQWYSFAYLFSMLTDSELLEMTDDKSPCLRLYAYIGLYHNKYPEISKVRNLLLADTSRLSSLEGCVLDETTVGKGVNQINTWYVEKSMNDFLKALQNDSNYKIKLFSDLVNKRQIKRFPISL